MVVTADRGIPSSVAFFRKRADAIAEEKKFRARMNPDYEDTELFKIDLEELLAKNTVRVEV
jgi:hypothetical protein